jgi:hypothetical protein
MNNLEFKIFDENKESYILGDLLNMPKFFAGWNSNPHGSDVLYKLFKKTALQYKNNILGIYDSYRTDENEPFPNVEKIKLSVDTYIENNKKNSILEQLLLSCNDTNTLFVHLRSGDKGIVEDQYINTIINLTSKYNKIVILAGIHQNAERSHHFPNVTESIDNLKISLSKIYLKNSNIILDLNEPDLHLSIMRKCKNLLLHKGGFSMLGGIIFSGNNLYVTDLFYPIQHNNTEYFENITNYTKI